MNGIARLGTLLLLMAGVAQGFAQTSNAPATNKARVLLVTGIDHPLHHWRETEPVLKGTLEKDSRLDVRVVEDPAFLDSAALEHYDVVVLHFQNWKTKGPGEKARQNLEAFVGSGKGLMMVHFACGAWHDEWSQFEDIAGRIWFGEKPGLGKRQHDKYGPFHVEITQTNNPIVRGMEDFDTQDELYTCLIGSRPIEVLAQAKSKADGKYYPMAFVSSYNKGRVFQCVLGHDVKAMSTPAVQELYRRGCAYVAGLDPVAAPQ